jgi:hypothetical protein
VIGSFSATSTAEPFDLGGFVPLPVVTAPARNTNWDLHSISIDQARSGQSVELTLLRILAGGGLYEWTVVAPGPRRELKLPSLAKLAPDAALPVGSITVVTTLAHIAAVDGLDFDYGKLRYRQLAERGWNAYATDTILTQH